MDSTDSTAGGDPYQRGIARGRQLGSYAALQTARRALREAGPLPLAQALDRLVGPDDLALVLRMLEDATDRAADVLRRMQEGGE